MTWAGCGSDSTSSRNKRAAISLTDQASLGLTGIGKRARLMTKQLIFEELCRHRAAIDWHERFLCASTEVVNGARAQLLTCSSVTDYKHRRVAGSYARYFFNGGQEGRRAANELLRGDSENKVCTSCRATVGTPP